MGGRVEGEREGGKNVSTGKGRSASGEKEREVEGKVTTLRDIYTARFVFLEQIKSERMTGIPEREE